MKRGGGRMWWALINGCQKLLTLRLSQADSQACLLWCGSVGNSFSAYVNPTPAKPYHQPHRTAYLVLHWIFGYTNIPPINQFYWFSCVVYIVPPNYTALQYSQSHPPSSLWEERIGTPWNVFDSWKLRCKSMREFAKSFRSKSFKYPFLWIKFLRINCPRSPPEFFL